MAEKEAKSIDQATLEMLEKAASDGCSTVFDRAETMKPCPIGAEGSCCSNCAMGPCRVPLPKGKEETPEDKKKRTGVCGATAETIAARNFARKIAAGAASHSDHGRRVVEAFMLILIILDFFGNERGKCFGALLLILLANVTRNAAKIKSWIPLIGFGNHMYLLDHSVDGLVGQFFRAVAAATGEYLDKLTANLLVLFAGLLPIWVQPQEQPIEGLLR